MAADISKSASEERFSGKEAVRLSAELLLTAGIELFPLDVRRLLACFRRQVFLSTYAALQAQSEQADESTAADPRTISGDGFCTRIRGALIGAGDEPFLGSMWCIYYNERAEKTRIRFTLMHELGHVLLKHHQILGTDTITNPCISPEYRAADAQADRFSINILAPAPAVTRLLKEHGFSVPNEPCGEWRVTNSGAPFLRNLGCTPDPIRLLMTAFGISRAAAQRRLSELRYENELWRELDPLLYRKIEGIAHRSGWYCWVCHTRRRTTSAYCPGCGKLGQYEFKDFGKPSRPVMGLRDNGQFEFCSVCGNTAYPSDALCCPICGSPVINECGNALQTDGDFVRSGMQVIRGTHRCRPTDIYCGVCGVLTAFGAQHGPRENFWLPVPGSERCRIRGTMYPSVLGHENGRLKPCPVCGSEKTIRGGLCCADCGQALESRCMNQENEAHPCAPDDRYCRICGSPSLFYTSGLLPDYRNTETYASLTDAEEKTASRTAIQMLIDPDGALRVRDQEEE